MGAAVPESGVAGVIADLTEVKDPGDLETLRALVGPALRALAPSGRIIVVGRPPREAGTPAGRARRALEGITRSLAKELRGGATANLVLVGEGAEANTEAPLRFLLSGRSAYVDAQVIEVGAGPAAAPADWTRPWTGRSPW